jgi:DNA helicase-2/ATP-dependent DNA helicase PcrA
MNKILCPECGKALVKRERRSDGKPFWGCSGFPICRKIVNWTSDTQEVEKKVVFVKEDVFLPSEYQVAIYDWVKSHMADGGGKRALVVKALAGSGKTTTGVKMLSFLSKDLDIIYLAFNNRIAEHMRTKLPDYVNCKTYHALGFAAIRGFEKNVTVDKDKVNKIIDRFLDPYSQRSLYSPIQQIVSLVKANLTSTSVEDLQFIVDRYGIELNGDADMIFGVIPSIIEQCKAMTNIIDFDDMCWLPVVLDLPMKKFNFIFVDEAQDTNKVQIALALMSMDEESRIVAVGDEYQSIYGFRGADVDAIPNLIQHFDADVLPLSVTYRCPRSHVLQINRLFPDIGLEFAPDAKDGIIRNITKADFIKEVKPADMVLCRTNAPLVPHAFSLIRDGLKAVILGRDIGTGLITMIRKTVKKQRISNINELIVALTEYSSRESQKLSDQNKNAQAQALQDKTETIFALCDGIDTIDELEGKINSIFSDDVEGVVFSSVHKAKGLEAERVYILHSELMPHPMAKSSWEVQQENNIKYVAYTRSLSELIFVG